MMINEVLGIKHPIIGGPMYPCSNPELVAAISNAGAIGVIQPVTLTFVLGFELREGIRHIKKMTSQPLGFNALIEASSKRYETKMKQWVDIALEEGIRFFITSLGNPKWVVEKVHAKGGLVYHDTTEVKWAKIAKEAGVDGLVAVNSSAGGHTGIYDKKELFEILKPFELPIICAGGVGGKKSYQEAMAIGYSGVQMGTRFIATTECDVSDSYKKAIVDAKKEDIVLTQNLTGIMLSVIRPKKEQELKPNSFIEWALKQRYLKIFIRLFLAMKAMAYLKRTRVSEDKDVMLLAGKSVDGVKKIQSVEEVIRDLTQK